MSEEIDDSTPQQKKLCLQSDGILFIKKEFRLEVTKTTEIPFERKLTGQNKRKDRRVKHLDNNTKLCFEIANGKECLRETCKFSHDLEKYLKEKGPDLGDVCPNVSAFGYCKYGVKCRFLKGHKDSTCPGDRNDDTQDAVLNVMSRDFQKLLRSGKLSTPKSDAFSKIWHDFHDKKPKESLVAVPEPDSSTQSGNVEVDLKKESTPTHSEKLSRFELDQSLVTELSTTPRKRLDFRHKTYLAPLTTVGNVPFRRICKEFGVDITCAEMSLAGNLLSGMQSEWATVKRHKSEDIFGVQVTANHPIQFSKAVEVMDGNLSLDFVDLNLGCPVEGICAKGCGSVLMERKSKLREMVLGASIFSTPLTVKIRTGVRDKLNLAHKLVPLFQEWGVSGITIHGRSKEQRYSKLADWDYIKQCSQLVDRSSDSHPFFFGNGDCFGYEEYKNILETDTIDGVMIGRGALIKPWIFTEIKEKRVWDITAGERLDILKKYANYGMEFWGSDNTGVEQTRRFLLEWMSFLHRYVPVGLIEVLPQKMNLRPERFRGRNELETLMASDRSSDWIKLSEMVLGKCADGFEFIPKHKSSAYENVEPCNG